LRAAMRDADLRFDNQTGIQRVRTEDRSLERHGDV
jgi:hypothetical protein